MISNLNIRNLILIEDARIEFGPGLNIITGETGAGKSAVLAAIRLVLGARADIDLIRRGAELAIVEAEVDGHLVRRELHRSGRSRAFLDDQLVSLSELKDALSSIELVDQAAAHSLIEKQREYLDSFSGVTSAFAEQFDQWQNAKTKLDALSAKDLSECEKVKETLAWIEETNWKEGEDDRLSEDHHTLTHAQDLLEKIDALTNALSNLSPVKRIAYGLAPFRELKEAAEWIDTGIANLDEANRFLSSYAARLEADPNRLFTVEKRLGEIESLKRRFGNYEKIAALKTELKAKLDLFANLDQEIENATAELEKTERETRAAAAVLTMQRKTGAARFAEIISEELKSLNLPDARFTVAITEKPLSPTGADEVRFLFAANPGASLLPIDHASGGELSRILFAIKTTLAGIEGNTGLVFDEIDSNVGGKTAAILGEKLQTMAEKKQLIAVTHFVQVARFAKDHFLVSKKTKDGAAKTAVEKLLDRKEEYARMTGLN